MYTKLKYKFEKLELDGNIIAVPIGENASQFRGVIKLNDTGAKILDMLKDDVSEEKIIEELATQYHVPFEKLSSDVRRCVGIFQERGMLIEGS